MQDLVTVACNLRLLKQMEGEDFNNSELEMEVIDEQGVFYMATSDDED